MQQVNSCCTFFALAVALIIGVARRYQIDLATLIKEVRALFAEDSSNEVMAMLTSRLMLLRVLSYYGDFQDGFQEV